MTGERIRDYELLEPIAQGRAGVYRARHVGVEQERAIRILETGITTAQFKERFSREARILSSMRHPNIIELYEFGELGDGKLFEILELLDGETLARRIERDTSLVVRNALRITREAALALHVSHNNGIIHRDLCP